MSDKNKTKAPTSAGEACATGATFTTILPIPPSPQKAVLAVAGCLTGMAVNGINNALKDDKIDNAVEAIIQRPIEEGEIELGGIAPPPPAANSPAANPSVQNAGHNSQQI